MEIECLNNFVVKKVNGGLTVFIPLTFYLSPNELRCLKGVRIFNFHGPHENRFELSSDPVMFYEPEKKAKIRFPLTIRPEENNMNVLWLGFEVEKNASFESGRYNCDLLLTFANDIQIDFQVIFKLDFENRYGNMISMDRAFKGFSQVANFLIFVITISLFFLWNMNCNTYTYDQGLFSKANIALFLGFLLTFFGLKLKGLLGIFKNLRTITQVWNYPEFFFDSEFLKIIRARFSWIGFLFFLIFTIGGIYFLWSVALPIKENPDLIFSDIDKPNICDISPARVYRKDLKRIKVFYKTDHIGKTIRVGFIRLKESENFFGFINKWFPQDNDIIVDYNKAILKYENQELPLPTKEIIMVNVFRGNPQDRGEREILGYLKGKKNLSGFLDIAVEPRADGEILAFSNCYARELTYIEVYEKIALIRNRINKRKGKNYYAAIENIDEFLTDEDDNLLFFNNILEEDKFVSVQTVVKIGQEIGKRIINSRREFGLNVRHLTCLVGFFENIDFEGKFEDSEIIQICGWVKGLYGQYGNVQLIDWYNTKIFIRFLLIVETTLAKESSACIHRFILDTILEKSGVELRQKQIYLEECARLGVLGLKERQEYFLEKKQIEMFRSYKNTKGDGIGKFLQELENISRASNNENNNTFIEYFKSEIDWSEKS